MNLSDDKDINARMLAMGEAAKSAAHQLALATTESKNKALEAMAAAIHRHEANILSANSIDVEQAKTKNLSSALIDRLSLNSQRIEAMAMGLEVISALPDPVGTILLEMKRPNGLEINRIRVPIGVIGVIYESRPNVTADAAGLCLKSGNAVILRGGSESFHSSAAIIVAIHEGLGEANLPLTAVQMVPIQDRAAVSILLTMDAFIDVIIPRGGQPLIERIAAESRIPLFKHLAGLCHTYIHSDADKEMARKIVLNAKMRRTGICGATEVLLIDRAIIQSHLPDIINDLMAAGCEIRGDDDVAKLDSRVKRAQSQDFSTEFLDAVIAIKAIANLSAAIKHIEQFGTHHTDAIITQNQDAADRFLKEVDSAIVMHNTSTQFADGGEFGMGAEIGIATGKLHARGPVGVEQLTTFKYQVRGSGQLRP